MDRRKFLRLVPAAIVATIIVPELITNKEEVKYIAGVDPAIGMDSFIVMKSRRKGYTWLQQAEWQFNKDWHKQMEIEWMKYNRTMINIQSYIK
jgi:hypothetical protein